MPADARPGTLQLARGQHSVMFPAKTFELKVF